MEIHTDLHAHSAYAGGARAGGGSQLEQEKRIVKRFHDSARFSPLKGVNLIGTGDCQFEPWMNFLKSNLNEYTNGMYSYSGIPSDSSKDLPLYILQTELIFTGPIPNSKNKKRVHIIILFPNFETIVVLNKLLEDWGVARQNMARPFVVCTTVDEVNERIHAIMDIDHLIEMVPAHVLTPEGIYGGNNRINMLSEFFGPSSSRFNAVETGLSADPTILGLIPELDNLTLISNADAHSAALNRVGREFTSFSINKMDYPSLIYAIRKNQVTKTAEFHPTEGRYFLTGHRELRKRPGPHEKNQYCYYSPKHTPKNDICPQCGKFLTVGVLQRAFEVCKSQGENRKIGDGPKRPFVTMIPLIEIIAHSRGIKSLTSKSILNTYQNVISVVGSEVRLWTDPTVVEELSHPDFELIKNNIITIQGGRFAFLPPGFDGSYGQLSLGKSVDFEDMIKINN